MTPTPATVLLARLMARARLRHLQLFVRLAEVGSLKRAAEAMHISQPAASQLLADLEGLVDLPLFERHARGVRLAPAGALLLPRLRPILDAMADASEALSQAQRQGEGVVRLAAITGAVSGWLVRALPAFAQAEPGIQIQVFECEVDRCTELVAQGQAELALCRRPPAMPVGCAFVPHLHDEFVVACGPQHPLAQQTGLSWAQLAQQRWLLPPVQTAARREFDERMRALGAVPETSPVVTRVSALTWAMLRGDRLLTLVPLGVVRQLVQAGQLATVGLAAPVPFAPLGWLLPPGGASVATQRLLQHLQTMD